MRDAYLWPNSAGYRLVEFNDTVGVAVRPYVGQVSSCGRMRFIAKIYRRHLVSNAKCRLTCGESPRFVGINELEGKNFDVETDSFISQPIKA